MKNQFLKFMCISWLGLGANIAMAQTYQVSSPDGKLQVTVEAGQQLTWQISHENTPVLSPSEMAMYCTSLKNQRNFTFGEEVKVTKVKKTSTKTTFPTPFYKKSQVKDEYNQLVLTCKGGYQVEFRAYNAGAAYRFVSQQSKPFIVKDEKAHFNFPADGPAFIPYVNDNRNGERYCFSFESYYDEKPLSQMYLDSLAITPLLVEIANQKKAVIMEAGLESYPGMFLVANRDTQQGLQARFAPVSMEHKIGGHAELNLIPTKRADYIARVPWTTPGNSRPHFPWRVVIVSTHDTELANNDLMQCLSPACRLDDTSWIKPGKVAWDWWNTCNLTGVDFEAGMNTPTYKAYIDFAAANKLEYIIIDDGWSGKESLMTDLNPDIDLPTLIAYGQQKGVGIILWASWRNITGQGTGKGMDEVMAHYAAMGIKGFKVDFFDRDDQAVIISAEALAACAAKHHLLLDLHGLKPYGIHRTYPNIVNYEGVKGLENAKWEPLINGAPLHDFPRYDVTAPYLRQLLGPLDYTPGAMVNATRGTFRAINDHPMSQGTRVHQMAMYTIFEAPLQMLADSPSKYMKEQTCTDFIAQVPTTFDETIAIDGQIAEYLTMARRKGDTWFVGSMTNWTPRDLVIDLSFLGEGSYQIEMFSDGINAHREATDYRKEVRTVTAKDKLKVHLAPGGGWTARISRR